MVKSLTEWLRDHAVGESRDIDWVAAELEQRCRGMKIEPPAADRIERIVRAALHAYDDRFCGEIYDRLPPAQAVTLRAFSLGKLAGWEPVR